MIMLYRIWTVLAAVIVVTVTAVVGTLTALPFVVVPRGRRERYCNLTVRLFGHGVLRLAFLCRPRVVGLENVPRGEPYLVISNHRSWVDPVLHAAYAGTSGLSKLEILYFPVVGFYAYLTGCVFFKRSSKAERRQAFHEVMMMLNSGTPLFVFPEGTRTRSGALREKISLRLVEACYDDEIAVLPAVVWNTERSMPVSPPIVVPFQSVDLKYLTPVHPRDYPDAASFAQAAWGAVVREVADYS